MTEDHPDPHALLLDGAVASFGVPMRPGWREAALGNLLTVAAAAGFVAAFPLEDEAEYGPVFRP